MTPYVLSREYNRFSEELVASALHDLGLVRSFMETLPEPEVQPQMKGRPMSTLAPDRAGGSVVWSCHSLTRAALKLPFRLSWTVRDGWFKEVGCEHSWLFYYGPGCERIILDVYPIACMSGPIMVDAGARLWHGHYIAPAFSEEEQATFKAEAEIAWAAAQSKGRGGA